MGRPNVEFYSSVDGVVQGPSRRLGVVSLSFVVLVFFCFLVLDIVERNAELAAVAHDARLASILGLHGETHDEEEEEERETSKCSRNGLVVDWGSSGIRAVPAHLGSGTPAKGHKVEMATPLDTSGMQDVLSTLEAMNVSCGQSVAFGTAGFRIFPKLEEQWNVVREWNEAHKLFDDCTVDSHGGCQTLNGSSEAWFETSSMMMQEANLPNNFVMLSCGGASVQLGVRGGNVDRREACVEDIGRRSAHDGSRARVFHDGAFFSFLADHSDSNDYVAGGVVEMRAKFDNWLEAHGMTENPCISTHVNDNFTTSTTCAVHGASGNQPCLVDAFGSYITRFPGMPGTDREACNASVASFLSMDRMLSSWRRSDACREMMAVAELVGFSGSFGRPTQLGYEATTHWSDIQNTHRKAARHRIVETADTLRDGLFGGALTSMLLMEFLRQLGMRDDSEVRTIKAMVEEGVAATRNLSLGWIEC